MTIFYPEGTPTLGRTKLQAVTTVADLAAPKLATEINHASSVDASCYIYPAGWNPSATTAKGTKPARLCSTTELQQFNRTSYELADLQYVYNPQALDSAVGNELKLKLQEGTVVNLVERIGIDADTAWAVGQRTITHKVIVGPQITSGDRTDDNGEFFITQSVIYTNAGPVHGVVAA